MGRSLYGKGGGVVVFKLFASMMADTSVTTTNEIHGQVIQFFEVV